MSEDSCALSEPPSMNQSSKFESMLVDEKDANELDAESPSKSQDDEIKEQEEHKGGVPASKLALIIPPVGDNQHKRVTSARSHHRRHQSIGENPFLTTGAKAGTTVGGSNEDQSPESQKTPQNQYETLAEFTKENLINYQEDGKTISGTDGVVENENTADFDNFKQGVEVGAEELSLEEEDGDKPPDVKNVNGYAFFTRDFRVLKNANYGNRDQSDMILAKLQEEFGSFQASKDSVQILAEQHEQNQQSFAEPPPPEPEVSRYSMDERMAEELNMEMIHMSQRNSSQNMEGSFENNLRGSFERGSLVEDVRVQSLLGSMIQGNQSITEHEFKMSLQRRGDENSIEQYNEENTDDGIPEVDVYMESNRNSLSSKAEDNLLNKNDNDTVDVDADDQEPPEQEQVAEDESQDDDLTA